MNEQDILKGIDRALKHVPTDRLDAIKVESAMRMQKHDAITKQSKNHWVSYSFLSVAAMFLVFFMSYQYYLGAIDSIIVFDTNPSIEIRTNRKDEVTAVNALNDDGVKILEQIDFIDMNIEQTIDQIVETLLAEGYIVSDSIVLVSVYNKDTNKASVQAYQVKAEIQRVSGSKQVNPITITQTMDRTNTIVDLANTYGISEGKMTFIRNIMILNPELELEGLVKMSLSELIDMSSQMKLDLNKIINQDAVDRINAIEFETDEYEDEDDDDDDDEDEDDDEADDDDFDAEDDDEADDDDFDDEDEIGRASCRERV